MAVEVEIKARVGDPERVRAFLDAHAVCVRKYYKDDTYYARGDSFANMVRLRLDRGARLFAAKQRVLIDGVEVNEEREYSFTKKESRTILAFLTKVMGYREYARKIKKGRAYRYRGVLVELSEVKTLGRFVELELVDSPLSKEEQIALLYDVLIEMGLSRADVDTIPYVDALRASKGLSPPTYGA